jgi:hypothetical protein
MPPETARASARLAPALALLLLLATPAHALKVATWNLMGYENPGEGPGLPSAYITARQANFRTVMAALDPDVIVTEEMNSAAAADSFKLNVLGNVASGAWAGTWVSVGGNEGIGIFYKSARVTVSNVSSIVTGGPRNTFVALVKPVGYTKNTGWFRVYAVHFKAGNTPADATTRNSEAGALRTTLNSTAGAGPNFVVCGDMNLYDGTEGAYLRLTESQTSNFGRSVDYLSMPLTWHQNGLYAGVFTQCPCNSCTTTGQSGGGLDDRFDLAITSTTLQDGTGLDYVPGSYTPFGNDGAHFNTDINAGTNFAVGTTVANALHDVADHIPVMITLQLPAKYSAPSQFALGDAIVGGSPAQNLNVANAAAAPAAVLGYTLAASAGFSTPAGPFTAAAGAGPNAHAIGMDASAIGVKSGTLTLASNDNDTTSKVVSLSGRVLAHASPSLDSLAATTAGVLDFGDRAAGSFADSSVRILDQGWNALQAQLVVTGAAVTGDGRFSIVGGFSPATLGPVGATWNVHFDDAGAAADSTYTGLLTFTTADENLPGATALAPVTVTLRARVVAGSAGVGDRPLALRFLPPSPNPLRAATELAFDLPRAAAVSLGIYDLEGRRVASLVEGTLGAGHHSRRWEARSAAGRAVPAGVYFVRFVTPGLTRIARIAVLP